MKIGDQICIKGNLDRMGYKIPAGPWSICLIEGSAIVASNGRHWIAGRIYSGRPGYPPSLYGDDAVLWETEHAARENHDDRVAGEAA